MAESKSDTKPTDDDVVDLNEKTDVDDDDEDDDGLKKPGVKFSKSSSSSLSGEKVTSVQSKTSSVGIEVYRSSSYGDEIGYFLKSKAAVQENRDAIVNSMRDMFGEYKDCCGILDYEGYFKESERGIYCIQFSNDGRRLVIGFGSGTVLMMGTKSNRIYGTIFEGKESSLPATCIRFHPLWSQKFYVSARDSVTLCSCQLEPGGKTTIITEKNNEVNSIDLNMLGNIMVSVGKDSVVRLYDTDKYTKIKEYKREEFQPRQGAESKTAGYHTNRLFAVRFNPLDENMFVTGGWDKLVKIWDVRTPDGCVDTIVGPHIFGEAIDVKKNTILTGSWTAKKTIQLWDIRNMEHELLLHCAPKNTPPLKEGYFVGSARFFSGDPSNDVIVLASMTSNSFDVVSLKNNVILHSFMTSNVVVGNHSFETKVSYGGMLQTLRIADFFMYGMPSNIKLLV